MKEIISASQLREEKREEAAGDEPVNTVILANDQPQDEVGNTLLHLAAQQEDEKEIKRLLEAGANPNVTNHLFKTPFHYIAEKNNAPLLTLFIRHPRFNFNTLDVRNNRHIMFSLIIQGNFFNVAHKLLASSRCDVNHYAYDGRTILHWAAENGHFDIAKMLLQNKKMDANSPTGESLYIHRASLGEMPLHLVANHPRLALLLIESGAQVNGLNNDRLTPLHFAAAKGHQEVAKLLIQHQAKIDAKDIRGNTPLHHALAAHDIEMALLLIEKGASLYSVNRKGRAVLNTVFDVIYNTKNAYLFVTLVKKLLDLPQDALASLFARPTIAETIWRKIEDFKTTIIPYGLWESCYTAAGYDSYLGWLPKEMLEDTLGLIPAPMHPVDPVNQYIDPASVEYFNTLFETSKEKIKDYIFAQIDADFKKDRENRPQVLMQQSEPLLFSAHPPVKRRRMNNETSAANDNPSDSKGASLQRRMQ